MTEDKTVITERENELLTTVIECRKQQSEAAMRIKEARIELAKLAPHKVGEIVKWVKKGRQKRAGGTIWHPKFEQQPDKEVVAVLVKVEAEVDTICDTELHYRYDFKPIKKDGGISQNSVYPRVSELEWTGEIHNIEENIPHKVSEVICINCKHRWIAARPCITQLKDLECPNCHKQGYVIETGEIMDADFE